MANVYKVWVGFSDMLDGGHVYFVGDIYPRKGYEPMEKRIYELATENNKLGVPLIGDPNIDPPQPEPAGDEQLPYVTVDDSGKILQVNLIGKWDKAELPTELPVVVATDNGDVLTVVNGAWAKANVPTEIAILDLTTDIVFIEATAASQNLTAESGAIEAFKAELNDGKVGFVRVTTSATTLGPTSILLPVNMKTAGTNLLCGGIITDNTPMTPNVFFVQITIWYSNFASIQIKAAS